MDKQDINYTNAKWGALANKICRLRDSQFDIIYMSGVISARKMKEYLRANNEDDDEWRDKINETLILQVSFAFISRISNTPCVGTFSPQRKQKTFERL